MLAYTLQKHTAGLSTGFVAAKRYTVHAVRRNRDAM